MKRKLIFVGVGVLLISAAMIFIAGRGGAGSERQRTHDELVLSPEGQLVVKPADKARMTVVYHDDAGKKSTNNPVPRR